jgi:hypothetical protein
MMAQVITHYRRKLRRFSIDGTTTRHIVVEENSVGIRVVVSEVGPINEKKSYIIGYEFHPVLRKRFLALEEAISAAKTVFHSSLISGAYEVVADTTADG